MARDCENCKNHTDGGCTKWECEYSPIERGEYGFSKYTYKCARCNTQSKRPLRECPKCGSEMRDRLYLCDPDKATGCKKTSCFVNGGACRHTANIEQARPAAKVGLDKWAKYDLERQNRKKKK